MSMNAFALWRSRTTIVCALLGAASVPAVAQQVPDIGFVSVGRAAPLPDDVNNHEQVGATLQRDGIRSFVDQPEPGTAIQ